MEGLLFNFILNTKGLAGFFENIREVIGIVFMIAGSWGAIMMLKDRQFRQMAAFFAIFAVGSFIVFAPDSFWGKDGTVQDTLKRNVIDKLEITLPQNIVNALDNN